VRNINWFRLGGAAAVSIALVGIVVGFMSAETGTRDDRFPPGLEQVAPMRDAQVQRQSQVIVDLAIGYLGDLALNGVAIPRDQYSYDPGQGLLTYPCVPVGSAPVPGAPQPDAATPEDWPACTIDPADVPVLPTPNATFTLRVWEIEQGEGSGAAYSWTFKTY
jgi:hypothetical protein